MGSMDSNRPTDSRSSNNQMGPYQKQIFIRDLKSNDAVRSSFLVTSKELFISKNSKPYLSLILSDRTGQIDTRIFEDADALSASFREGDVIAIAGKAHQFQNRLQLVVQHLTRLTPEEVELSDYLPTAGEDLEVLYTELLGIFRGLKNAWVRDLALRLLEHPEIAPRYKRCPAAKTIHHAFIGGLLVHSLQLIKVIDRILPLYPTLDRDLLIFGAAFHDFGKIFELSYHSVFGYTDEGRLVGHIAIGVNLIDREIQKMDGFPRELEWQLKHLVLSHHGKLEYGSPKRPHTLEALVLHYIDDLDSKINSIQTLMDGEQSGSRWTAYHRAYDNYYYKPDRRTDLPPTQ
jgi:3'-5' exoribonuclease